MQILANSLPREGDTQRAPSHAGAIIVAAGLTHGKDAHSLHESDILWAPLAGRPLLAWSVASIARAATIDEAVLVVASDRVQDAHVLSKSEGWKHVTIIPAGGLRRRDAVWSGLNALSPTCQWVVVHDATRPLVSTTLIADGFAAAQQTGAASASEPVKETIKRVHDGAIAETLDRSTLVLLQTPQVFERAHLLAAHQQSDPTLDPPDDATLAMAVGMRVATFPGSHDNLTIATPDDIAVAEALLLHGRK